MSHVVSKNVVVPDVIGRNKGASEFEGGPVGTHHEPYGSLHQSTKSSSYVHATLKTIAGIAGNVLEWYDFAVFGFFSDILGVVFFPKDQPEELSVMESFAVFGCAFFMRPVGGLIIGYIGDVSGRKNALEISIFLMASATTLLGCLPTYQQIGNPAILFLLIVRMLQGLSVGGQLMTSLVFTLEGHRRERWGLYGSFVMAGANFGTFVGGIVAYALRSSLTVDQLQRWGWRLPFLSGILISFCGIYLRFFCKDDEILPGHAPVPTNDEDDVPQKEVVQQEQSEDDFAAGNIHTISHPSTCQYRVNPLRMAFSIGNRRSLVASAMIPMVWAGGFYLSFVWMTIYMQDLIVPPISGAFGINSISLLLLGIWFPIAGLLSDYFGRKRIMTLGGIVFGGLGPVMILIIGRLGNGDVGFWLPFGCQTVLSISLALWGAPMCAWLVEAFEPSARLTSVAIGYNIAQGIAGGMSPFIATLLAEEVGSGSPGLLLLTLALISITGLWCVAPQHDTSFDPTNDDNEDLHSLELKEIT